MSTIHPVMASRQPYAPPRPRVAEARAQETTPDTVDSERLWVTMKLLAAREQLGREAEALGEGEWQAEDGSTLSIELEDPFRAKRTLTRPDGSSSVLESDLSRLSLTERDPEGNTTVTFMDNSDHSITVEERSPSGELIYSKRYESSNTPSGPYNRFPGSG